MKPFVNAKEMTDAYFAFIDGLCATYLAIRQAQSPEAFEGRGVVIPESQVTTALSGQREMQRHEGFALHLNHLQQRAAASPPFPLSALFHKVSATDFQQIVILLALAPELNRKYERIFAYLQDNINEKRATLGLAADLYGLISELETGELYTLYNDRHPINRFLLAPPQKEKATYASGLARPLICRQTTLLALTETPHLPKPLPSACVLLSASEDAEPLTGRETLEQAARFLRHFYGKKEAAMLQLFGTDGSGKHFALQYIAGKLKKNVLCISCDTLVSFSTENRQTLMDTALSYCFLTGSIPALIYFDFKKMPEGERETIAGWFLREMGALSGAFVVCAQEPLKIKYAPHLNILQLTIPRLTIGEQKLFWEDFSSRQALPLSPETDLLRIVSFYSLTPGRIYEVLSLAEAECLSLGLLYVTEAAISRAVRQICKPRLAELTQPLTTSFTWADLQLEKEPTEQLHRLCDRIRYRWQVKESWGFDKKLPYGKGVSVLLYGPSGTGKTMAAQVLAGEFGLDAYRVDMSRIMDKYIGETEKKLAELFDAAKDSNAILFFDEADALFAKRTEVTDSNDRYANVETAYLLQRMEEYSGISIMATNAAQNFDEAFKRRISFMVNLPMPSVETRKNLWQAVFPAEAPLKRNANLDFFAERFELSGSSIKNVAVAAAYLAAAEGTEITRDCIARSVKEEYLKTGRVLMEHELY